MAKQKKEKKPKRPFFSYSEEKMNDAIKAVRENGMSRKTAAKTFGIPRSTLIRKLSGTVPLKRKMGPRTELSPAEETLLVDWILAMARKGFPVHRTNLLTTVKKILEATDREVRYVTGMPGRSWFEGFLKRHPNIKQKHAESLSKARAAVTQDRIEGWFDKILDYLKQEKLDHILEDPTRIFNADEAGFSLCPKSGKVLGPNSYKEDFHQRVSSEKEQITVMATFSADGKYVPPLLIFPYKKMPKVIVESIPENWGLGRSDSGWMNSEVFFEYVSNHFIPFLKSENITRPVILFVDGHRSHLTQEVSKLCDENGVILISLFPNTTHIMQPADVSVFKPLKAGWKSSVRNWKFENFPKEVTRFTFGSILKVVFDEYATVKTIQNGFRKCGLYPFDKNNVDYSKCIPNRKTEIPNGTDQTSNFPEKILTIIESKIGMELGEFKNTYTRKESWSGKVESTNLYKVWLSIKNDCTITPQQQSQIETEHVTAEDTDNISNNLVGEADLAETGRNQRENDDLEGSPKRPVEKDEDRENSLTFTERIVHVSPVPRVRPSTSWATPENASITFYDKRESEGFKVPTPFKKCIVFPKTPETKASTRKRTIFPAVVSSRIYREYYNDQMQKKTIPKTKKKKEDRKKMSDSSDSESDTVEYADEDLDLSDQEDLIIAAGMYVIVRYEEKYHPGIVLKKDSDGAEVKSMVKTGFDSWKWPPKEDILYYFNEDIVRVIKEPKLKNNRGLYNIPHMSKYE